MTGRFYIIKLVGGRKRAVQFTELSGFLSGCRAVVFCNTGEIPQITQFVAFGCQLLFLYELECSICAAFIWVHLYYISGRIDLADVCDRDAV